MLCYLSLCLSLSVSLCLSLSLSLYLSLSISIYLYLSLSISIFLSLWGVLDFNQEYKLRAPWGVFVVFASFLGKWWCSFLSFTNCQAAIYSGLVNWGALLSSLISWEVCVLNLFPAHTWIPGRMSLFLSPVTW